MKIDNFAISMFMTCPAKFQLRMLEGWTSRRKSAALGFGGAIHEGLATWYRTGNLEASLRSITEVWPSNVPIDDWRTKEKCLRTMIEYVKRYPDENFQIVGMPGNPMVECTATLDTEMYLSCFSCGATVGAWDRVANMCLCCHQPLERIEYGGIFDGLVEFGDTVFVLEHKTTSQMGTYYFDQFKPNNQVTGYVWMAHKMSGRPVGGAIVNGIGIYKASATKFDRQITTRSDDNIREWLENIRVVCEMIQECKRTNVWPMFTTSCTMYGKCEYHQVHVLGTETERRKLLEQDYVKETWEYEERTGVKDE